MDVRVDTETRRKREPVGIPNGMKVAAGWSWRLLVVMALLAVILWLIVQLRLVAIPFAIALLLAALLQPVAAWLVRRRLPSALASAIVLLGGLAIVVGVVSIVVREFIRGLPGLTDQVSAGLDQVRDWLVNGPIGVSQDQIDSAIDSAQDLIVENQATLTSGAVSTAVTLGHVLTGLLLALFSLFFFLREGRRIWLWAVRLLPKPIGPDVDEAGVRAFRTLVSYVRATILVAFVDAVGIGVWVAILGVPLALPLGALVFLASFIPLIGATISGIVAVLVALVANGPWTALLALIGVLAVQQLEGHVLQPLLLGRAVKVHPLAVVLAIATGVIVAGITGALIAVPLVACLNAAILYLARDRHLATPDDAGADADPDPPAEQPVDPAGTAVDPPAPEDGGGSRAPAS